MKLPRFSLLIVRILMVSLIVGAMVYLAYQNPGIVRLIRRMTSPVVTPQKEWTLRMSTIYLLCDHQETEQKRFTSLESLQAELQLYQGSETPTIGGNSYLLSFSQPNLCHSCQENQFLKAQGQQVVIIRGTPAKPGPAQNKIPFKVNELPEAERKDLERGIPFKDQKDMLQLMEGLKGLITN